MLLNIETDKESEVLKFYNLVNMQFIIVCYHPVSTNTKKSFDIWKKLLNAIIKYKNKIIFIKPNIDYGNVDLVNYMNEINFTKKITQKRYSDNDFVYYFLSSIRNKINDPLGKKSITTD